MAHCPCGSEIEYSKCCELYINGTENAPTAEALMRSRFTAYTLCDISYIIETCHPEIRNKQNAEELLNWCQRAEFKTLQVLETIAGGEDDTLGRVRFIAWILEADNLSPLHELSDFEKVDGEWTYKSGKSQKTRMPGPNDRCPCGSGKKYKTCCG